MGRQRGEALMGDVGLLFPGQGSQYIGMGKDLAEAYPEAREAFEEADDTLGFALSGLCWEGPTEELRRTVNAQPAILVHSIAVWRVLERRTPAAVLAAGHSLGEFSAYVAGGSIDFADAVITVRRRGELMFEAGRQRPGSMAAILGLDDAAVDAVCREASTDDEVVVPANYNSSGQIVISGDIRAVERAGELAKQAGAKRTIPLNVSGAFHSPLMEVAVSGLREQLSTVELRDPSFPVISNVTAEPVSSAAGARELLVEQLTSPVRWVASLNTMLAAAPDTLLEIGPGHVLAGLARRVSREVPVRSLGTAQEVDAYLGEG
ncbi:ACP S-malonyltransferase [soil metagenome]